MTPHVSLVMPAWRVPALWLREAVASALEEDGCDLELVVVDDESPEPVEQVLANVTDPRLRVVHTPHRGAYGARDVGIAAARGRVLRFLDADDVVVPGSTAHLLRLLDGRDDLVSYGATIVCDEELRPGRVVASSVQGDAVAACLLGRFEVRVVAMAFPRAVVDAAGAWDAGFAVSGDWDWVLRALEHAYVRGDRRAAVLYRRHASSLTRLADVAAGEEARHQIVDRYLERHPEQRGGALERAARAAAHLDRAVAYAHAGDGRRALGRLGRAARLQPLGALRAVPATAWALARRSSTALPPGPRAST